MDCTEVVLGPLLAQLWKLYCDRVEYARRYVAMVEARGGRAVNDHIAFRALNVRTGSQPLGIRTIERVFLPLGYKVAGSYAFSEKYLTARYYEHPNSTWPKIFISQLEVDRLGDQAPAPVRNGVREAGIPMKPIIEGKPGSKLRQTATQAVEVDCPVRDAGGQLTTRRWTYAYAIPLNGRCKNGRDRYPG